MNRKEYNKNQMILLAMVLGLGLACLFILNLLMPPVPTPTSMNQTPKEEEPVELDSTYIATVTLDPGHGGYDDGSLGLNDELEKEITLSISKKIQAILEKQQVEVIMTRDSDEVSWIDDNVADLDARLKIAYDSNSDFMVSIHCNSSDEDQENIAGSEVYVNEKQSDSLAIANTINDQLKKLSASIANRGVKTDMDLHLILFNEIPSVIVEVGFMTNSSDLAFITSEQGQQQIAQAIAEGIMNKIKK